MSSISCIFCEREAKDDHREHILPQSIGGDLWGVLPAGLVCRSCNSYFGSKVEQRALASFPFNVWRVFAGIPTKKRKPPSLTVLQGRVTGTGVGGLAGIDPASPKMEAGIRESRVTQMCVIAEIDDTAAVCQLLLKVGLEILALNDPARARADRYDAARRIARAPKPGDKRAFVLAADVDKFFGHLSGGPHFFNSIIATDADVSEVVGLPGVDFLHLRWPGIDFICPMDAHVVDDGDRASVNSDGRKLYEVTFGPHLRT